MVIPASVREICEGAFMSCEELKSVEFAPGSELERVGSMAFSGTGVGRNIVFPAGVEVAENAFE